MRVIYNVLLFTISAVLVLHLTNAQTRRLIINSFKGGPSTLTTNALGMPQFVTGAKATVSGSRLQLLTTSGQPMAFTTGLSNGQGSCLPIPPENNIETMLSFRLLSPPGVDMTITLETGTNGCGGQRNGSASVRLSSYNALDGQDTFIRIPLTDFGTQAQDWFNGRLRALTLSVPAMQWAALIQLDDCQLVSRPRLYPLRQQSDLKSLISQINQGPPQQGWSPVRQDGRCGPSFGWASCSAGACCSARGWCGSTPLHCLSVQSLVAGLHY